MLTWKPSDRQKRGLPHSSITRQTRHLGEESSDTAFTKPRRVNWYGAFSGNDANVSCLQMKNLIFANVFKIFFVYLLRIFSVCSLVDLIFLSVLHFETVFEIIVLF